MPPKSQRSESSKSRFLFVNEDAKTVSGVAKDAELNRQKQRHVQLLHHAKAHKSKHIRNSTMEGLAGSGSFVLADTSSVGPEAPSMLHPWSSDSTHLYPGYTENGFSEDTLQGQLSTQTYASIQSHGPEILKSIEQDYLRHTNAFAHSAKRQFAGSRTAEVAITNPLRSVTLHPLFSDTHALVQKWGPTLMRYHTTILLPEAFFVDFRCLSMQQTRLATHVQDFLQQTMAHPAHMYSFLAIVSTQMLGKEGHLNLLDARDQGSQGTPISASALWPSSNSQLPEIFKVQAISAIRHELSNSNLTAGLITAVKNLVGYTYNAEGFASAQPHHHAMLRMIHTWGGLALLSPLFSETMFLQHWSIHLRSFTRPTLPVASFDPGAGPPDVQSIISQLRQSSSGNSKLASSFGILAQPKPYILSPEILSLAVSLADLLRFSRWTETQTKAALHTEVPRGHGIESQGPQTHDPAHFQYIARRHVALGYHLLSLPPDVMYGKMNEAIRIALVFAAALTRSPAGQRCASRSMGLGRLRLLLHEAVAGGKDGEYRDKLWSDIPGGTEALLWVCVIAGLTAGKGKANADYRRWFRGVAGECAMVLMDASRDASAFAESDDLAESDVTSTAQRTSARPEHIVEPATAAAIFATENLATACEVNSDTINLHPGWSAFTFTTTSMQQTSNMATTTASSSDETLPYFSMCPEQPPTDGFDHTYPLTLPSRGVYEKTGPQNYSPAGTHAWGHDDFDAFAPAPQLKRRDKSIDGPAATAEEQDKSNSSERSAEGEVNCKRDQPRVQQILQGFIWDESLLSSLGREFWLEG